jgi:hypothetical protein
MGNFWKNYGLGLSFMLLFLVTWILQTWAGWVSFVAEEQQHQQAAELFGSSGYVWHWAETTFENWQSDLLGQGLMVIFGAYWLYKGSSQSRETEDETLAIVQRIEQRLGQLEQARGTAQRGAVEAPRRAG